MKYEDFRRQAKTGDLFFTAWNAPFSRLIRFATSSKVSHTGMFVWLGDRLFIVESVEGTGVQILPASQYVKKMQGKIWWGRLKEEKFSEEEILSRVFSTNKNLPQIGEDYDMAGALLAIFCNTKSRQVFCSEYVRKIQDIEFYATKRGMLPTDVAEKTSGLTLLEK